MRDLESIEHLRVWSTESGPLEHMECSLQEISVSKLIRVIFVWPWNENAQRNGNRSIWSAYLRDKIAFGFWLFKRTLSWKNFMPKELFYKSINTSLWCHAATPIKQFLLHIRVFFGGKLMFWSFHPLADKTTSEHLPKLFFKVIWKSL